MPGDTALEKKAAEAVRRYHMLAGGERVVVSVSGGPDSLALLHFLHGIASEYALTLSVFTLDHMMRGAESVADADFVEEAARGLGLPCERARADVPAFREESGFSPQDAARRVRLAKLAQYADAESADRIALGHTADDQVETFLMRVVQGGGTQGLSGIAPVSGRVVRPLITTWRSEVEDYCDALGLTPRIDATNESGQYLRNRVRRQLVPYLEGEFGPGVKEVLVREAESLAIDRDLLDELVAARFAEAARVTPGEVRLSLERLAAMPPAMQRGVLRLAWQRLLPDEPPPSWRHVVDVLGKLMDAESGAGLDLPRAVRAEREYGELVLRVREDETEDVEPYAATLSIPGRVSLPDGEVLSAERVAIDRPANDRDPRVELVRPDVALPLEVRPPRPGDRFHPLGAPGRCKLSDFFIDAKVPRRLRAAWPVVFSAGEVVWLAGARLDERFKLRDSDREAVRLRLERAGNMIGAPGGEEEL